MEHDTRHTDRTGHVVPAETTEPTRHVSPAEDAERAQSASPVGPVGAQPGIEQGGLGEVRDERDRAARAAEAADVHTETDPLRLLEREDRSGR